MNIEMFYTWLSGFVVGVVVITFIVVANRRVNTPCDDAIYALRYLVRLKAYKDKKGKDSYYAARVNLAWDQARRALNMESSK